ncbi:MAG: GTP 3',8-cyclase MoaA [archaeon GB-1867-035]|nr:GTP 3',8-cyclase MoaA [Candidatus Culexmicrobium profundum]
MIYDKYGRPLRSLRITVTHRCNFNCIFCHREGEEFTTQEMTPEEIYKISKIAASFGINKIKLTGGEPLVREDIDKIIKLLASINGIKDLAMTTNASLLEEKASILSEAGLMRINVSLPSIKNRTYSEITGSNFTPQKIIKGVKKAMESGMKPIKINMVILRGLNENEIDEMMKLAGKLKVILQLIELEPIGISYEKFKQLHVDLDAIENKLRMKALRVITRRDMQNRRRYILPGNIEVEVVKPLENGSFCAACTRMRVTADGKLKPCLMRNDNLVDILSKIREGAHESQLKEIFLEAAKRREPYWKKKDMP